MNTYYIYHIPGVKIGCSQNIKKRINHQKFSHYEILEEHSDVYLASKREQELQKQYGYRVDNIPYYQSLKMITKAQEISLKTKNEWLPKVDWKAREEKIDQKAKWDKVKLSENYIKMDRRSIGLKSSTHRKKIILQYDLDGNFIKEWDCGVNELSRKYGFNVGGVCQGKKHNKTIGGYQWIYKTSEDYPKQINKFKNNSFKKVIQKDLKGNIIKIWDNQTQAAESLNCTTQSISNVCRGKSKTAKGFLWERYV
jgi:hypothetical protein